MQVSPVPQTPKAPQIPRSRRFKTFRVIGALVLREVESRDARTSLGFLWAFIEPIGVIILMSVVFSLVMRSPPLGTNFPLFYLSGMLPYGIYAEMARKTSSALRFSRSLLGFPAVTPLDAIFARFLLNFFVNIVVFVILALIIIWMYDLTVHIDMIRACQSLLIAGALGLGFGCMNTVLFMASPTYETIWGLLTRPLMIASGVLILIDAVPQPYQSWLWWNPVGHVVSMMHEAMYSTYERSDLSVMYPLFLAMGAFTIGMITLHRYIRDAMDE